MKQRTREAELAKSDEPEYFPAALLTQPKGARQEYFEQQCLIEHPRLLETLRATMQSNLPSRRGREQREGQERWYWSLVHRSCWEKQHLSVYLKSACSRRRAAQMEAILASFPLPALPQQDQSQPF